MDQLKTAIEFLKRRKITNEPKNSKLIKRIPELIPASEVIAILEMVESGEFEAFYQKKKFDEPGFFNFEL